MRGARSLKFWPHNSPLKSTKLTARIRCISKVLAHANFEAVLCETATRQRGGRQRKKKGIVRRVGGKTRAAVLFRVIATRTEASKGFVFVSQLGSVRWITLHCSFMHAFFLNWWSGESTLTKRERLCLERVSCTTFVLTFLAVAPYRVDVGNLVN